MHLVSAESIRSGVVASVAELDTATLSPGAVIRFGIRVGATGAAADHGHAVTVVEREKAPAATRKRAVAKARPATKRLA